tara:strand:+ start:39 stop:458 length:420 start_codon:yes stop_codon:yes gene_type:complete
MNKKEYDKAYYAANREKRLSQSKLNYTENRDRISFVGKQYYEENRAKLIKRNKENRDSKKLGYYLVYALPNFNNTNEVYCGVTQNIIARMQKHSTSLNNTEGWFVLDVLKTRDEALEIEREYHDKGYKGINNSYKTNKI